MAEPQPQPDMMLILEACLFVVTFFLSSTLFHRQ